MGVFNHRNAAVGWLTWTVGKRVLKRKAKGAVPSIDTETERLIQEAIQTLLAGRTSIVIAHRLSTIRSADLILVFHHGEVRERGTHEELMQMDGLYRKLYEIQYREAVPAVI